MLQNDYVLLLDELRLKLLDVKPQIDDLADAIGLNPDVYKRQLPAGMILHILQGLWWNSPPPRGQR